jgi:hypothetical protein
MKGEKRERKGREKGEKRENEGREKGEKMCSRSPSPSHISPHIIPHILKIRLNIVPLICTI